MCASCECFHSTREAIGGSCTSFLEGLHSNWRTVRTAVMYYASISVIFYSEVALSMLCCMDLVVNATLLWLLVFARDNDAQTYTAWAISDNSMTHLLHWNEVFIVVLAFYLLESLVRIYYFLKLAYHHSQKVSDGELCCMKCHSALISAAMTSEIVMPHVISAISLILFFIYASAVTGSQTVKFHADYFANNPFTLGSAERTMEDGEEEDRSAVMRASMYYKLGSRILDGLQDCRYNRSVGLNASTEWLLRTGRLLDLVEADCARSESHCLFASRFVQLSAESVQALLIYLVIRCLFGHVINMHEYEVYNQQTRLQAGAGSTRLIRVFRVRHHKRAHRHSRISNVMQLPRQALMSIVNLGANVAARFRHSKEARATQELYAMPQDLLMPGQLDCAIGERMVAASTDPDFDDSSWAFDLDGEATSRGGAWREAPAGPRAILRKRPQSNLHWQQGDSDCGEEIEDGEGGQRYSHLTPSQLLESCQLPDPDSDGAPLPVLGAAGAHPLATDQQQDQELPQQEHQLYNRRDAATGKKVNVEHLKIPDLFPLMLASTDNSGPKQQQQTDQQYRLEGAAIAGKSKRTNRKRESHIVFSDETYYSLDA